MMNHDEEVHERHRDELQDRRERGGAQGELGGEGESAEWRAALGEHGSIEHLLALKVDAMEVTVVSEPTQLGHIRPRARRDAHPARPIIVTSAVPQSRLRPPGTANTAARGSRERKP